MKLNIKLTEGTRASASAKRLAQALRPKVGYKVFRTLKTMPKKRQLLYGQGVDKLTQYKWFTQQGLSTLEFTTVPSEAVKWMQAGHVVFGRSLLSASCGKGIHVLDPVGYWGLGHEDDGIPGCPVYTKYKKKKREFRVHVFKDKVVRVVEKKLRKDWNGPRDSKIRNLANGFVFCACLDEPAELRSLALKASRVVQSDFKGVDIGYNEKQNECFVIEVNSAPGIEGTNLEAYVNAIVG